VTTPDDPAPEVAEGMLLMADLPKGRATVLDVARMAGVSGRTVSRVVAGGDNVSPETRQRVLDAVQVLRFRPNRLARDLRTGGVSTTVGFVVGDLSNQFYSQVAAGVERVLGELGLTMLLAATRDDPLQEPRTVGALLEHRVLALLLVPIGEDHAYLEHEAALGTPVVAVDRPAANVDVDSVVFDNATGAADAVRSLINAGHRRVAFVGSDRTIYTHRERLAGYHRALADGGIQARPSWVRTDAPDSGSAERATRQLLEGSDAPTAIFAGNNLAAMGVLRALRARPEPVGFIAFDDFDLADTLGISVIAHDPGQMGSEAAELALSSHRDGQRPSRQIVLPTRLIRRGSGEIPPAR
jgi:LacI family transcriptional regulator